MDAELRIELLQNALRNLTTKYINENTSSKFYDTKIWEYSLNQNIETKDIFVDKLLIWEPDDIDREDKPMIIDVIEMPISNLISMIFKKLNS